jgi:hypothetical protein
MPKKVNSERLLNERTVNIPKNHVITPSIFVAYSLET